jgi:hypothetical protein
MATVTAICNGALQALGQRTIADYNENTFGANKCRENYDDARQEAIASYTWRFAVRHTDLALAAGEDDPVWGYVFTKPAGCLNVFSVTDADGTEIDFEVRGDFILANEEEARAVYVVDVTDTSKYDIGFTAYLKYVLASKLAMPITKKLEMVSAMTAQAALAFSLAAPLSARQARKDKSSTIVGSRA